MIPQLQRETTVTTSESTPHWSLGTRIGFRFLFCYFALYLAPGAIGSLGARQVLPAPLRDLWAAFWHPIVPWVGTNILHLTGDFRELANGSGDQLYDYVLLFCIFVVAVIATAVWSYVDRQRPNYERLHAWMRLIVRLAAAAAMMEYGLAKVFRAQFPEPPLVRLIDPLGQTSPMGLLWTMTGLSRAYSFFGGFGELLAGIMLIVPQLTTLGALVMLGVMSNVLMLNLCYDVPRKIYSIHLILIGLFLLLPELHRLANVFVFNRATEPVRQVPLFRKPQWNSMAVSFQIVFGVIALALGTYQAQIDQTKFSTHLGPSYRGIWAVDDFTLDESPHPPLVTDKERWGHVVFDTPDVLNVQMMDGTLQQYLLRLNEADNRLTISAFDSPRKGSLEIENLQPDHMTLAGRFDDRPITVQLRRLDLSDPNKFLLINRGFHWVNQYTFRR